MSKGIGFEPGRENNAVMCYHTTLIVPPRQLALRFGREWDLIRDFRPTYHVSAFAHEEYPIITADPHIQLFRWGLIPFWTDSVEDAVAIRNRTANARAETIFIKPSFREPIRKRRCLVPASGFFDWRHEHNRKVPCYITVKDAPIIAFAGIYDCWHNKELNEYVGTYSIITTDANPLMRRIHNTNFRMPVILHPEDEQRWLDPALTQDRIAAMLRPFPERMMEERIIRNDFIRKAPDDASILDPVAG